MALRPFQVLAAFAACFALLSAPPANAQWHYDGAGVYAARLVAGRQTFARKLTRL